MTKSAVSVVILTHNEEEKIGAALASVAWADELLVADSSSTDRTSEIAAQFGATVLQIPFTGFGALRQAATAHARHPWVFSLDADERCPPALRDEILRTVADPAAADAYLVPRLNTFLGRQIRHGGWFPDYRQPQLFRRNRLTYRENDLVHEGYEVHGCVGRLREPLEQIPYRDLSEAIQKMDRYTSLNARQHHARGRRSGPFAAVAHGAWAFAKSYVFQRGILDGQAGFVVALLRGENSIYKHLKLVELAEEIAATAPRQEKESLLRSGKNLARVAQSAQT
jgi:glycosyltransferase involved in cell wall biosynthesis